MHAAKGLEFPLVFLVGLEEGILPHANSLQGADSEGVPDDRAVEEERRLFYVGITRAKRQLTLSYAARRTRFGRDQEREVSRFIDEIGLDQLCILDAQTETPADQSTGKATFAQIRAALAARQAKLQ
jgi:ATP-dependent DNA helicase Rep